MAKEKAKLNWVAQPRQAAFLSRGEDEVLYGGSAGSGKSDSLLAFLISRAARFPNSKGLYLRRKFTDMAKGGAAIDRSKELLNGIAKWDANHHRWTFPNKSIIEFGYLDSEDDKYNYQSSQYDSVCWDELTQFTLGQYLYINSRCRSTVDGMKPLVRAATNPGGVGHSWCRARFVSPAVPGEPFAIPLEPGQQKQRYGCFIPALLQDNKVLMERDPGYWDRLMTLPEHERRALAYGDWDVFEGQYFCYDDKTDILTIDGWKSVLNVTVDDKVATIDESGQLLFSSPTNVQAFDFDGYMYTYQGRVLDFSVTPGHKMYAHTHNTSKQFKLVEIEDLTDTTHHLRTAKSWCGEIRAETTICENIPYAHTKTYTFNTNDWLELLGWYLSEGSLLTPSKKYSVKHRSKYIGFSITQSHYQDKIDSIHALLKRLGIVYSFDGKRFRVSSVLLASYFSQFGKHDTKYIPRDILQLHPSHLIHLYKTLMAGDGCPRGCGGQLYATTSKQLADDVQELCLRLSKVASITLTEPKQLQHKPQYRVSIYNDGRIDSIVRKEHIKRTKYNGKVGCVTVEPYHTVFVRRNGKPMWCGNSEWKQDKHIVLPFSIPNHWRKWGGYDWGYAKPLAFYILTKDPDTDRVYVARELYAIELRDGEAIEQIKAVIGGDKVDVIYADPSIWTRKSHDDSLSTAERYMTGGLPLQPANNDRISGWRRMRDLLADGKDGLPMLQVFSNCRHFIRTFPVLVYDNNRPEDLDSDSEDH